MRAARLFGFALVGAAWLSLMACTTPAYQRDPVTAAWFHAVAMGDIEYMKAALADGLAPDVRRADGWTALEVAIRQRDAYTVRFLLHNGADPKQLNHLGEPMLISAVYTGDYLSARLLLEQGGYDDGTNIYGMNAVELALARGNDFILAELVAEPAGREALENALAQNPQPWLQSIDELPVRFPGEPQRLWDVYGRSSSER
ncbi:hypothetical protein CAI21_19690 [Alkalilimnicola ehrlichii]|uniref:Uncharacterized protein n=2 Tax=Alkalilimnicola ehrlichii TaxID=351052 RepID=A0A3E0WJ76_9GAMM|nr:hypothetical protein CAI21_19690 [Alkalilimnicola ehrlichii]RFA32273.1 hypothetical protein CAL65_20110 [Alkalilimnicola ehrlichii]